MKERREQVLSELMRDIAKKENLKDYKYEYETGKNKKNGFVSSMYNVKLFTPLKTYNIIIKFAPVNENFRKSLPLKEVYRREIMLYDTVVPLMADLLMKANLTPRLDYISKFYGSCMEDFHEAIVLEDLRESGYELWDYKKPMNDDHIRYVLENYGKFHANGFALKHLRPKVFDENINSIRSTLFVHDDFKEFQEFIPKQMDDVAKGLTAPEDSKYLEAFLKHKDTVTEVMKSMDDTDKYFTLLHGDCWCNNMMFRYSDDNGKIKPTDMKFLDWQLLWYGPPVNDFSYFFYSNASEDMYERLEEYKDVYYNSLKSQLKAFNLDSNRVFPREEFDKQMKPHAKYGMTLAFLIMHIKLFKDEMKDHEDTDGTDESIYDQFNCDNRDMTEFYKMSKPLVKHCFKSGFI